MSLEEEIKRRRTFGIISHPDAGKTTLTEKLLLFGGAIQEAGAVKSNKVKRTATSDFMEIEKQRGISVATSVMAFEYEGRKINILDTPGHQDFAEDTYRTLTAVDSAIVVIDVAKGVEAQTEKLVEVSRMRNIPLIIFINKLDREGRDAFDLLDEVEQKLGLNVTPMSWPIGMGQDFQGVYNLQDDKLLLFTEQLKQKIGEQVELNGLEDDRLAEFVGQLPSEKLKEEAELIQGVYPPFDMEAYQKGMQSPVFFGSALNNFGVQDLLEVFVRIAPHPQPKKAEERMVHPNEEGFSGFVFKIHANMDPKHRDRLAFVKIVSGVFERNKPYKHVRLGKDLKFSSPTTFMASRKAIMDRAYPGDIVGLHDTGNFRIGDGLSSGESLNFKGIPSFSPEHFRFINNEDPLKSKQLAKGIDQLMDEGVAQLFTLESNGRKIIGTVGALQYEVIQYRLEHEYGARCSYESYPAHKACWLTSEDDKQLEEFRKLKQRFIARDKYGRLVYLADSSFSLQMAIEKYDKLQFRLKSED
jgi:peptide chain release factor 3